MKQAPFSRPKECKCPAWELDKTTRVQQRKSYAHKKRAKFAYLFISLYLPGTGNTKIKETSQVCVR